MTTWTRRAALVVAALTTGCATGGSLNVPRAGAPEVRERLREQWQPHFAMEAKVTEIDWRLVSTNSALCREHRLYDGAAYLDREIYKHFHRDRVWPHPLRPDADRVVQYVAPGSPAWERGLRPGDAAPFTAQRSVGVVVDPDVRDGLLRMVCKTSVGVPRTSEANAWTDGRATMITAGMLEFAANDDEVAFVLAHELAHNSLDHLGKMTSNAIKGGLGGLLADLGAAMLGVNTYGAGTSAGMEAGAGAYSVEFEAEADYLAAYMMARAGYDPGNVSDLWARRAGSAPPVWATTHPLNAERELNIAAYAAEIEAKQAAGEELIPAGISPRG